MRHLNSIKRLFIVALVSMPVMAMAQFTIDSIANFRPYDQRGINVFESPKQSNYPFTGIKVKVGAGFTQQFQGLKHENSALNNTGTGANRLYPLTPGFMTAQANLYLDVQLADGIVLNVSNYMSARHHNEFWVKGGYLQFDKLPFKGKVADDIMKLVTIKIGHMEINYGDAHFRRPDGGHTLYSPFMEGNIMDEFATEIGGEVYLKSDKGVIAMLGMTNGMIKGNIDSPKVTVQDPTAKKSPSIYGKLGFDKQVASNVRVRVTASVYHNGNNDGSGLTIFGGDRTGSNYQNVMEKGIPGSLPATTAVAFSGRFNPGLSNKLTASMLNGFLKVSGFELFGTYEIAKGRKNTETSDRKTTQAAVDGVYRFGAKENLYIGVRYNTVKSDIGYTSDVTINRFAAAAGWFLTKNILLKGEIVNQKYLDFPNTDYRNGGQFKGYVIEATIGF